jgi:hypothetical protein
MKTFIVNGDLLEEAQTVGQNLTEIETVNKALEEFIQRRKQSRILELFGTIDYDPDYNYKAQRNVQ